MNFGFCRYCFGLFILLITTNLFAQKQVSFTIDDPNTNETPALPWRDRNNAILNTLKDHNLKAAIFVCGMRVNNSKGKELLNSWDNAGHLICNHSYSHLYYNSKSLSAENFIRDFFRGDSVIRTYKNYTKLFRFPYLKEGNTDAKRDSMRSVLAENNYSNGHVTIDASDWFIDAEMSKAIKSDPNVDLTPYREYYIQHILGRANYYDSLAKKIFNREIKHTLLIHHSLLNALFLDDLLIALKENGWILIDANQAFKDEIFKEHPPISPCGESIVWQCAKLNPATSESLRYPAEDGEYEKGPFEKFVKEYELKQIKK